MDILFFGCCVWLNLWVNWCMIYGIYGDYFCYCYFSVVVVWLGMWYNFGVCERFEK